jgi:hypothetical protein
MIISRKFEKGGTVLVTMKKGELSVEAKSKSKVVPSAMSKKEEALVG